MGRLGLDLLFLAGCGVCSFGFWLAWHPLGFIVGGAITAAFAFTGAYKRGSEIE